MTDLWSLPDHDLTESVTNDLEKHFFLRCEPAARPRHLREQLAELEVNSPAASNAIKPKKGRRLLPILLPFNRPWFPDLGFLIRFDTEPDSEKADGEVKQAEALDENAANEEQPPSPYDASLFKALHSMLFSRIWISGFLTLFAGEFRGRMICKPGTLKRVR
jgi:hypothetical protein